MLDKREVQKVIRRALAEDRGAGDITTSALIKPTMRVQARISVRERAVVCGIDIIREVYRLIDKTLRVKVYRRDGATVNKNAHILELSGHARSILTGERVALNFLSHLSGISTLTRTYVKKVKGTRAKIYDTRKTTPGLRALEKYAVKIGGGCNHRRGLYDQVLVKDNHIAALARDRAYDSARLVHTVRRRVKRNVLIEIEVDSLAQLKKVLPAHPDIILLDNMRTETLKKAMTMIRRAKPSIKVEASGGITVQNVRSIARLGVDRISVGAITHSAPSVDFSMEVIT